ncbi:MAG TPA: DUF4307 domain-containing protein [Jiangellaceae bacterium]|nr:DUF4307 domain-containing protein [Jiangellaceae bacterium]
MPTARPADRYGDQARRRSWAWWFAIVGLLCAAGVGWLLSRAPTDAVSGVVAWQVPADGAMSVTIEVVRRPGTEVTCDLVALDLRHVVVGQVKVEVPAGGEWRTRVDAEIPLQGDAVAPDLRDCESNDER